MHSEQMKLAALGAAPEEAVHRREEQRHKQARCEAAADPGLERQP